MAAAKLTLSVEPDLVTKAKKYALKHHTSVSKVFSELLNQAIKKDDTEEDPLLNELAKLDIPENIKSLSGVLKGTYPDDMPYKDMKNSYLKEKYDL